MRRPFLLSLVFASALGALSANVAKSEGRGKAPPVPARVRALWGTWDVERVAVNVQERASWTFEPNDARLLGRTLILDETGASFNGLDEPCPQTRWTAHPSSFAAVLVTRFHHAGKHTPAPKPVDFDLSIDVGATLQVLPICEQLRKPGAQQHQLTDKWIAAISDDRLLLGFDGVALLMLKRRTSESKIAASFPCTSARTLTESAICHSFELAAWDRSVAAAWSGAYKKTSSRAALLEGQQAWLKKRDACGPQVTCISEQLRTRVMQLVSAR